MTIREYLKNHILIFDGAFGTYYSAKYNEKSQVCEIANLTHPERVKDVHKEYIQAGAKAVRLNTFGAYPEFLSDENSLNEEERQNLQRTVVSAAVKAAQDAVLESGEEVFVFADLGPAPGDTDEQVRDNYIQLADLFLDAGLTCFVFETLAQETGVLEACAHIREVCPDAFISVSFGVMPDGYSREGRYYKNLCKCVHESGLADIVGLNCVSSAKHQELLLERLHLKDYSHLSSMPNAAYPVVRGFRTFYDGSAKYFAEQMASIAQKGVRVLGGCCGTTPEYISAVCAAVSEIAVKEVSFALLSDETGACVSVFSEEEEAEKNLHLTNRLRLKLESGKKVIAVELDPPKNADVTKFMEGAVRLRNAGVDTLTIADCPIARARMDSTLLACKVKRELDFDVIPHMTCRDRNINATKGLLLGGQAEGIRNVLIITGDPIPSAERDEVKAVYRFNSRKMIGYVNSLNEELFTEEPLMVYGALNVNARNFAVELERAKGKIAEGCKGFLTQPALTNQAIENLRLAKETLGKEIFILGGIIPVVSEKNALFMNAEINGIEVPENMIEAYRGADREQGEELAVRFTTEIAEKIAPFVDGFYLMTPFNRIRLMEKIVEKIKEF